MLDRRSTPVMEHTPTINAENRDFYSGFRQATLDFELKYKRQATALDETQITQMYIRVSAQEHRSDFWKAGYQAGFFAAFFGVLYRWTVVTHWTLGEMARVQYHIDNVRGGS